MTYHNDQDQKDRLLGFFMKHMVPIFFTFVKDSDSRSAITTCFVLSVQDKWFLVTAGHCLEEIECLITEHGYRITKCRLLDSLGTDAKHFEPIPFAYESVLTSHINDNANFDYGIIAVSSYYRQLMEENHIQPLNEDVWKLQPSIADFYTLLGVPSELVNVSNENVELVPALFHVTPLAERPDGFSETDMPLFYGSIKLGEGITSIRGMSGGPIFAFQQDEQGRLKYWLTALQSRWLPNSHFIAACSTKLLGEAIEAMLTKTPEHG
ncbi:MAG: hypothetical protein HZB51_20590 [Chloroflexi bacterium]|nr:hypothetical protein [Chloroflexota bacterium]